ncbi:hypothetical protein DYL61_25780 [Pseudomonas nabeulensis]|uniref:Uncharacterized protein n=1 Tax=Pseudomonas nabeulensis TaxID=2293833 RepID=A0A4Z0AM44_9PSED|nr:hypothetical protein DYL61_25780 [Pseudomonas nabeulensis]
MAGTSTNPRMRGCACASKHGTAKPSPCFRAQTRMRKPSHPWKNASVEAELYEAGKTRMRFPGSVGIRRYGFP